MIEEAMPGGQRPLPPGQGGGAEPRLERADVDDEHRQHEHAGE
jgi:hypothetical protein